MSEKLQDIINLTRLTRPIGYMLLFWPCLWGLTLSYDFSTGYQKFFYFGFLFFLGSVLMRSAGCIINDIVDKDYDKKVYRTKTRPIASGKISIFEGLIISGTLCLIALSVLIQFNNLTIFLALASMPLAFTYPYMKRFTYWPQLFLGITFNYGLILGWTSTVESLNLMPIILYVGAIFWTLGYDTIYGYQDIKDDEIIGIKSTSIKFKSEPKKFLYLCYSTTIFSILIIGYMMNFNIFFFIFNIAIIFHLLILQLKKLNINDPDNCFKIFKSNNQLGLLVFVNILIGKIFI
tara:strand:- start:877 stop:1749 length:873 start_codon:yes stop_codon:yes gene_type:complete